MSQVRKWPKTTKLLIYPLSSHVGIKISWLNRATLSVSGVRCCHTEQRGAICCTLPMSIRSCLMWRFSWGSLARGSGGSSSPVKSSQLSRTEREKRTNIHMATAQTVRKRYNQKAEKVMEKESTSLSLGSHCAPSHFWAAEHPPHLTPQEFWPLSATSICHSVRPSVF